MSAKRVTLDPKSNQKNSKKIKYLTIAHSPLSSLNNSHDSALKNFFPMNFALKQSLSNTPVFQYFHTSTVQSGLAYTPSQIQECVSKGIPISNFTVSESFYDGTINATFDSFDASSRRGYDIVDAWNDQMDSRERIRDAYHNNDITIPNE